MNYLPRRSMTLVYFGTVAVTWGSTWIGESNEPVSLLVALAGYFAVLTVAGRRGLYVGKLYARGMLVLDNGEMLSYTLGEVRVTQITPFETRMAPIRHRFDLSGTLGDVWLVDGVGRQVSRTVPVNADVSVGERAEFANLSFRTAV